MSKSLAKHSNQPYRATPLDNAPWAAVVTVVFLFAVIGLSLLALALL